MRSYRLAYAATRYRVSRWNDLADPIFDGVGLVSFKSRDNVFFYFPKILASFLSSTSCFPFSSLCLKVGIVRLASSDR